MPVFYALFPAYAGVIPLQAPIALSINTFPRIRRGDPVVNGKPLVKGAFSPHTQG